MTDYPDSLLSIIANAAEQHREDIDQAVECAEKAWLADESAPEFAAQLVRQALRELIHGYRHRMNVSLRKAAGEFGGPAKVVPGEVTSAIAERALLDSYTIAGRTLGSILGKELPSLQKTEQEKSDGAAFNARLCERLAAIVPEDKTVREVVTERQAWKLLRELKKPQAKSRRREKAVA